MQQTRSGAGSARPSGTDGSDYLYRMVVDSRYKKVAQGKSHLSTLILIQAVLEFFGAINIFLLKAKHESLDTLTVSATVICFISLMIGELGRKRSWVNFLKFYVLGSSMAMLLSIACLGRSNLLLVDFKGWTGWETKKFELLRIGGVVLGLLVEVVAVSTTISLIHNMAPPKRAS